MLAVQVFQICVRLPTHRVVELLIKGLYNRRPPVIAKATHLRPYGFESGCSNV